MQIEELEEEEVQVNLSRADSRETDKTSNK